MCNKGTRFQFSHNFSPLLITQMEATLDGQPVNHRIRVNELHGKKVAWSDSTTDDYLNRPDTEDLDPLCFFEMTMKYTKIFKTKKQVRDTEFHDDEDSDEDNDDNQDVPDNGTRSQYSFRDSHPGSKFCYLIKRRLEVIPIVYMPRGKLCRIEDLGLNISPPTEEISIAREDYAKMALMMFFPFRTIHDLKMNGSYWSLFQSELNLFLAGQPTKFWKRGFTILQNIQDRYTLEKKLHRARDLITLNTTCGQSQNYTSPTSNNADDDEYPDITEFTSSTDDRYVYSLVFISEIFFYKIKKNIYHNSYILYFTNSNDYGLEVLQQQDERNQFEIINRMLHNEQHLIGPRPELNTSLFQQSPTTPQCIQPSQIDNENTSPILHERSYRSMIQLILKTVSCDDDYTHLFSDSDNDDSDSDNHDNNDTTTTPLETIPSMKAFAKDISNKDSIKLDEQQYIAYEAICATFLLCLVREGYDCTTELGKYLKDTIDDCTSGEIDDVIEELEARGGNEQLLMFLSGPAGAGKTTAVKVAEKFCYHFCKSVGSLWHDTNFLFTAYTGSAASYSGGITICKVGYINKNGDLTLEEILQWRYVKILIIDEISFMKDDELQRLDKRLKECRNRTKIFGGISIIFAGDFRQLEPSGAKDSDLLFSRESSGVFERSLNAVIFLNNVHRFKDDPEYGKMLKRMWFNDLSTTDRKRINTRVIGKNGVTLPDSFNGVDTSYACPTNKERNAIHASNFKQHVERTCPLITNNDNPCDKTCIVYARISSSNSKRSRVTINHTLKHRIITTCGDDNVKSGTKLIDPALCLYVGAFVICVIDNQSLKEKVPRGNGTMCRVVGIKLKNNATSFEWINYYNRKVWTVSAEHVQYIELEHYPKSQTITKLEESINRVKTRLDKGDYDNNNDKHKKDLTKLDQLTNALHTENKKHRFTLQPKTYSTSVKVKPHQFAKTNMKFKCRMTQLPVNLNDATTGHKLQGMSKDAIIITSWPKGGLFRNWEYVVLSRVRTLSGLYLFKEIDMNKSFKPSEELRLFFIRARAKQTRFMTILRTRRQRLMERKKEEELFLQSEL